MLISRMTGLTKEPWDLLTVKKAFFKHFGGCDEAQDITHSESGAQLNGNDLLNSLNHGSALEEE